MTTHRSPAATTASESPFGADLAGVLPPSAGVSAQGNLTVGGCDTVSLAAEMGTPLFVYDENALRDRCRELLAAFEGTPTRGRVVYASKAFNCLAMARLVAEEGLSIDVSTAGELGVALAAGMEPERIVLHGNNKSDEELQTAVSSGVGRVVVDSFDDIDRLDAIVSRAGSSPMRVHVRLTPGVDADTHEFIRTGQEDSKFGLGWRNGQAIEAVRRIAAVPTLELVGVHCHIGSQIAEIGGFEEAAAAVVEFAAEAADVSGEPVAELDLGGGLGIAYVCGDSTIPVRDWIWTLTSVVADAARSAGVDPPLVMVEPGRSLVGRAGVTLYTVGTIKPADPASTGTTYVAVDGGMSDNLRTALYGARYETLLADRPLAPRTLRAHVAGKHCESGDVVVSDALLPADIGRGEVLVTPATGAYGYVMANNYNLVPRPAVVFAANGQARIVVRRETFDDVVSLMV